MTWEVLSCCMHKLLTLVYIEDFEPKWTLILLRRFQVVVHLLGSPSPALVFGNFEGYFEEDPFEKERVMVDNDIIGISNDRERNIRDYAMFDPNVMNIGIIRPKITVTQFEFKPMMFQMLRAIVQYSGYANEDPHLHLKQFLEVASNFKILEITDGALILSLFPYSLRDRARAS